MKKEKKEAACRKGQEVIIEIFDMGTDGEGIGQIDGYTLFVKDAIEGDKIRAKIIKVKKRFGYARLLEILVPSRWRTSPACACARQCGGCQLQHCSYEKQLAWKEKKVADCLSRIGGFSSEIPMEPIMGMEEPYHYRNKAQYPVGYDKEGNLVTGFYAGRTHTIIPNTDCVIGQPHDQMILKTVRAFMEKRGLSAYDETSHTGLVRHIMIRTGVYTGEVMVCLVINGKALPYSGEFVQELMGISSVPIKSVCINRNTQRTNRILGDTVKVLYGQPYITDEIDGIRYQISPLSFYQVNSGQMKKLYRTVLEYADLKGDETVWDLYCGIGTISLYLADKVKKIYGVEIVGQAVEDAKTNARINGITNAEFMAGAAEEIVPERFRECRGALRADVVILDPPRKGCDRKLLETVLLMQPERIIYVSCDPATLARDLKLLCGNQYELKRVKPCDMFGHSSHVESVIKLQRRDM